MLPVLCELSPELDIKSWIGLGIFFLVTCVPASIYFIKEIFHKSPDISRLISREEHEAAIKELRDLIVAAQAQRHTDDHLSQQTIRTLGDRISRLEGIISTLTKGKA